MIGCCEYQKLGNGEIPKRQRRGKYNQGRTIAVVYAKGASLTTVFQKRSRRTSDGKIVERNILRSL